MTRCRCCGFEPYVAEAEWRICPICGAGASRRPRAAPGPPRAADDGGIVAAGLALAGAGVGLLRVTAPRADALDPWIGLGSMLLALAAVRRLVRSRRERSPGLPVRREAPRWVPSLPGLCGLAAGAAIAASAGLLLLGSAALAALAHGAPRLHAPPVALSAAALASGAALVTFGLLGARRAAAALRVRRLATCGERAEARVIEVRSSAGEVEVVYEYMTIEGWYRCAERIRGRKLRDMGPLPDVGEAISVLHWPGRAERSCVWVGGGRA